MKRTFLFVVIALCLSHLTQNSALGQQITRVKFARGATNAVVTGRLRSFNSRAAFVIRVRRGQTLTVNQLRADESFRLVTLGIIDPTGDPASDADASCGSRQTVANTTAGDYTIRVAECRKTNSWRGNFRLKLTVK